jgi:hypothetical protein
LPYSLLAKERHMSPSKYLGTLDPEARTKLEQRLLSRQSGKCFICDQPIDLMLQKGQLDIDHIDPLAEEGLDAENNFALTHQSCNRSKGAANLQVARRIKEFERLQEEAKDSGKRGANLGDVLAQHGGAKASLRLRTNADRVEFSLSEAGDNSIHAVPLLEDKLSGMRSFFASFPLEYLHHDDRINPRSIGANIRGLIEEFLQKRPQLHVALAWWAPEADGAGLLKVFDGQHKAAAQILLGTRELPVRVFVEPDTNVLLQANTNAGGKLRQVAFDAAVSRVDEAQFAEVSQFAVPRVQRPIITVAEVLGWNDSEGADGRQGAALRTPQCVLAVAIEHSLAIGSARKVELAQKDVSGISAVALTPLAVPRIVVALSRIVSPARVSIEHGFLLLSPHVASRDRSWRPVSNNRQHLHHLAVILVGPLLGPL